MAFNSGTGQRRPNTPHAGHACLFDMQISQHFLSCFKRIRTRSATFTDGLSEECHMLRAEDVQSLNETIMKPSIMIQLRCDTHNSGSTFHVCRVWGRIWHPCSRRVWLWSARCVCMSQPCCNALDARTPRPPTPSPLLLSLLIVQLLTHCDAQLQCQDLP